MTIHSNNISGWPANINHWSSMDNECEHLIDRRKRPMNKKTKHSSNSVASTMIDRAVSSNCHSYCHTLNESYSSSSMLYRSPSSSNKNNNHKSTLRTNIMTNPSSSFNIHSRQLCQILDFIRLAIASSTTTSKTLTRIATRSPIISSSTTRNKSNLRLQASSSTTTTVAAAATSAIVNGRQTVSAAVDKEQVNEPVNFWSSTTAAEAAKTTTAMVTMTEQQQQQRHHINIEPNDENCTTNKAINVSSSMPQSLPPESTCTECCALLSVSLSSNSQWVNMKKSRKQHQSPPPALLSSSSSSSTTTTWFSLPQQQPQIHSQKQSASSYNTSVNNRRWKSRIGNITDRILSTSSLFVILLLLCTIMIHSAESCSSRSTPKPRPPTPTTRPNITFQTYVCPEAYAKWYCLNGATCFSVRIGESILYNCECSDGYMGQRCEFKDLDGSYLPSREKILVETAGIAGGVTLVIVLFVVLSIAYYSYLRNHMRAQSPPLLGYSHLHESSAIDDVQQDKKIGINNYRNNLTRHYRSQPQYSTFKTGTGSYGSTVYSSPIATNITDHSLLHSPMRQCVACMSNCVPVPQSPHAQFHQGYQIKSTDYQVENNCVLDMDHKGQSIIPVDTHHHQKRLHKNDFILH